MAFLTWAMLDLTQHTDSSILYICLFFVLYRLFTYSENGISQFGLSPALKPSFKLFQPTALYDIFIDHQLMWPWKIASTQNSMNWKDLSSQYETHMNVSYRGTLLGVEGDKGIPLENPLCYPVHNQLYIRKTWDWKMSQPATCSFADKWILFHTIYENKSSTLLPVIFKKKKMLFLLSVSDFKRKKIFIPGFQVIDFEFLQAMVIVFFLSRYLINFAWK